MHDMIAEEQTYGVRARQFPQEGRADDSRHQVNHYRVKSRILEFGGHEAR